jgi:hypothetical protein
MPVHFTIKSTSTSGKHPQSRGKKAAKRENNKNKKNEMPFQGQFLFNLWPAITFKSKLDSKATAL